MEDADYTHTKAKLDQLADIDLLLMVEKCISSGICHNRNGKANNEYMKDHHILSILSTGMLIIYMDRFIYIYMVELTL